MGMYKCMYVCRYVCTSADCAMQFYACVFIHVHGLTWHIYLLLSLLMCTSMCWCYIGPGPSAFGHAWCTLIIESMYIRNVCTIQFYARVCMSITLVHLLRNSVAKMCPGTIMAPDYCLACVARILWTNTTTNISSPCSAHCASRTISVTL